MGTQKEIAKLIISQDADYCLALKGNQGIAIALLTPKIYYLAYYNLTKEGGL